MTRIFEGKVAWISGASGDLGRAIARHLAELGARPVISGRNREKLEQIGREIGGGTLVLPLDVTQDAQVRAAVGTIVEAAGRIDFLVNSTTLPLFGDPEEIDDAVWWSVLDAKLMGYVRTIRAVIPHFRSRGGGAVVNLSGRGGRLPNPVHLPGGAANASINLITKGLADHYAKAGIRINAVAPGPIVSSRYASLRGASAPGTDRGVTPGQPADIAAATAFLLSDAARNINGVVLPVDGGSFPAV